MSTRSPPRSVALALLILASGPAYAASPAAAPIAADALIAAPEVEESALSAPRAWPADAETILLALRAGQASRAFGAEAASGWDAYYAAHGLTPTPEERFALQHFRATHPAVAAEVERLALAVARAAELRREFVESLPAGSAERLPAVVAAVAEGRGADLTTSDLELLEGLSIDPLVEGAAILASAAREAEARLPLARGVDAALRPTAPHALLGEESLVYPSEIILSLIPPVPPNRVEPAEPPSLVDALRALDPSIDIPSIQPNLASLPPELAAPLATLVDSLAADATADGGNTGYLTEAAIAATLSPLVRASYNLSQRPDGYLDELAGLRPGSWISADEPAEALFHYATGARAPRHAPATFVEGISELRATAGKPLSTGEVDRLRLVEHHLDSRVAAAIGALAKAQAQFESVVDPGSESAKSAAAHRSKASAIIASGAPLSRSDILVLQASASAERERRLAVIQHAAAVVSAADALREVVAEQDGRHEPDVAPPTGESSADGIRTVHRPSPVETWPRSSHDGGATAFPNDVLYQDGIVLILGSGSSVMTRANLPIAPALLVDLGGNDVYRARVAGVDAPALAASTAVTSRSLRSSIVIEAGGDDVYQIQEPYSLGGARGSPDLPALALLVDAAGNDRYSAGASSMGWGVDGFGILLDYAGDDAYRAEVSGLAGASTTRFTSIAFGILADHVGDDTYYTGKGFAHLFGPTASPQTFAVFLEGLGDDRYFGRCPAKKGIPCFATPRPNGPDPAELGYVAFVDSSGEDEYPSQGGAAGGPMVGPPSPDFGPSGAAVAFDGQGTFPDPVAGGTKDTDGDGTTDAAESLISTDPEDPNDKPLDVPSDPSSPSTGRFLLNIPSIIGIGLPGTSTYKHQYLISVDLGLDDSDDYSAPVAANGYAIDLGGNDTYRPPRESKYALAAAGPPLTGMLSPKSAMLLDLGGNDRYTSGPASQAYAQSDGALALLLDLSGDDIYRAPDGEAHAYSITGGSAYLLDLDGRDVYEGPTQGVVAAARRTLSVGSGQVVVSLGGMGREAVFLDARGSDVYNRSSIPLHPGQRDNYQGVVLRDFESVLELREGDTFAGFFELAGEDRYLVRESSSSKVMTDISSAKNGRMRVGPLDGNSSGGALAVFLDVNQPDGNSDGDGNAPDAVELAGGTDPSSRSDHPWTTSGFRLLLPRLGVVVGSEAPTVYPPQMDFALSVDLGGSDLYFGRVGATSPGWAASLHVDVPGDTRERDRYRFNGTESLSRFAVPRNVGFGRIASAPDADPDLHVGPTVEPRIGSAQGAGVLGVGVLWSASDGDFVVFAEESFRCECTRPVTALGAGQGAGIAGVGVLVVRGSGGSRFEANATAHGSHAAVGAPLTQARALSQGAGLLGVGILVSESRGSGDRYHLESWANGSLPLSQSAGQGFGGEGGIGILADGGGADRLTSGPVAQGASVADPGLRTRATTRAASGILEAVAPAIDLTLSVVYLGIDPVFSPIRLPVFVVHLRGEPGPTQVHAVAEFSRESVNTSVKEQEEALHAPDSGGLGIVVTSGGGTNVFEAPAMAQAFASGGIALVLDQEADDTRRLTHPLRSMGQAAAVNDGLALIVDLRGNDRYEAGGRAQGYADQGGAFLVDASGDDVYSASDLAQATVAADTLHANQGLTVAALLDRMGADSYILPPPGRGQGQAVVQRDPVSPLGPLHPEICMEDWECRQDIESCGTDPGYRSCIPQCYTGAGCGPPMPENSPAVPTYRVLKYMFPRMVPFYTSDVWVATAAQGVALFRDLGGSDRYDSRPPGQAPAPGPARNDRAWENSPTAGGYTAYFRGFGEDVDTAAAGAEQRARVGEASVQLAFFKPDSPAQAAGQPLSGRVGFRATVTGMASASVHRVELLADGVLLGRMTPASVESSEYRLVYDTSSVWTSGEPVVPDGARSFSVRVFPAVPGLDVEPLERRVQASVDNRPQARSIRTSANLSTLHGPVSIEIPVEPDLTFAASCPGGCTGSALLPTPAGDEWAPRGTPDPFPSDVPPVACSAPSCPVLTGGGGADGVYLRWQAATAPPALTAGSRLVGHRVLRHDPGTDQFAAIGFVDARDGNTFAHRSPDAGGTYRVDAIFFHPTAGARAVPSNGIAIAPNADAPAPVGGVRAISTGVQVHLVWHGRGDADAYRVCRAAVGNDGSSGPAACQDIAATSGGAAVERWTDASCNCGDRFRYEVFAKRADVQSAMGATAEVPASPGQFVSVVLTNATLNVEVLPWTYLGGGDTHKLTWDASATQIGDGWYTIRTTRVDWKGSFVQSNMTVRVDNSPPTSFVLAAEHIGLPWYDPATEQARFPFVARSERFENVSRILVLTAVEDGPWTSNMFAPSRTSHVLWGNVTVSSVRDGDTVRVIAFAQDAAGNVEGAEGLPWSPHLLTPYDALWFAQGEQRATSHRVDARVPHIATETMDIETRPGVVVPIRVRVQEVGSGLEEIYATVGPHRVPMSSSDDSWIGRWVAAGDGRHLVTVNATDRGQNLVTRVLGNITVDGTAPWVRNATLSFREGRLAGHVGDLFTISVEAVDNTTEPSRIVARADVGAVSSRGVVPLLYDATQGRFLSEEIELEGRGGSATAFVTVADEAGNVVSRTLPVRVNETPAAGAPPVVRELGATTATIGWTTELPAHARVEYGPTRRLGLDSPLERLGSNHSVRLTGLSPDTEYFYRAITVSEGGLRNASATLSFRTLPPLRVGVELDRGVAFARDAIAFTARVERHDGAPVEATLEAALHRSVGAPIPLERISSNATGVQEFDLTDAREGEYRLVVRATAGAMWGASLPLPVTVDRSPPLIVRGEAPVAQVGHPLHVSIQEKGSGIDAANSSMAVGGVPCAVHPAADGVWCLVPPREGEGNTTLTLRVADRAGNVARLDQPVRFDGAAPRLSDLEALGQAHGGYAPPGTLIRVAVQVEDATVSSVIASASFGEHSLNISLHRTSRVRYEGVIQVPEGAEDGEATLTVTATDAAGRAASRNTTLIVDATAPRITSALVASPDPGRVELIVRTDEETTARVVVPGEEANVLASASAPGLRHVLRIAHPQPALPFVAIVIVEDLAGNRAEAAVEGAVMRDSTPPTAVQSLQARDLGGGAVVVEWQPAEDDSGYVEYYVTRRVGSESTPPISVGAATTHVDWIPVGVVTAYSVYALDGSGQQGPPSSVYVTSSIRPVIESGGVDPPVAGPGRYRYHLRVNTSGGDAPEVTVRVNNESYRMRAVDEKCAPSCTFEVFVELMPQTLSGGSHRFSFLVRDGTYQVRFPEDQPGFGPVVVAGAPAPDWVAARRLSIPDAAGGVTAVVVAVLCIAAMGRGWFDRKR